MVKGIIIVAVGFALFVQAVFASDDLAKQSQNPVANMVSVPIENNFYTDVGPSGKNAFTSVLKPVYPMQVTSEINLINRFIAPMIYMESQDPSDFPAGLGPEDIDVDLGGQTVFPDTSSEFGLGNLQYQAFFSPAKPGKIIWGLGPVFELPTNTDSKLGTDTWSAGPAALLLAMPGDWVVGLLAQNLWDFASENGEPDVNKALIQPIINYNFDKGWYASATTTITANWEADSGDEWTVPVGGGLGRLVRFGNQPVDFKIMAYWLAEKPEFGADWYTQFTVKFLFPKG